MVVRQDHLFILPFFFNGESRMNLINAPQLCFFCRCGVNYLCFGCISKTQNGNRSAHLLRKNIKFRFLQSWKMILPSIYILVRIDAKIGLVNICIGSSCRCQQYTRLLVITSSTTHFIYDVSYLES